MATERRGTCFTTALDLAFAAEGRARDLMVVHGLPLGSGPLNRGLRYWHAWVEYVDASGGLRIVSEGLGKVVDIDRDLYYRCGALADEWLVRYTMKEAITLAVASEHVGPWEGLDPRADALALKCEV